VDVRIKRIDLPPENEKFIFDRMKAERERIAKQYRAEGQEEILPNMNKIIVGLDENQPLINLLPLGDASIFAAPSKEVTK